ncbi:hypothetical protein M9H77_03657 [Catharanthus roseus]|uniref:Uncharacterized protein n=1 Tax=Catharanthus roseus TaxID=4058 RepID=A0ACC0CBW3_CATRO|nr:hypothetical protein M9H77_03657 [Catharanthus roseus]
MSEEKRENSKEELNVSLEELKSLLDSYNFSSEFLIGDMCIIAFEGNLFLLMPSMTNCLSSHLSLEDLLMSSSVVLNSSCYGFGNLDDTFLVELNIVGFAFEFDRKSLQYNFSIKSTRGRSLESLGNFLSIVPLMPPFVMLPAFLLLFDSTTNPFRGEADGTTRKV